MTWYCKNLMKSIQDQFNCFFYQALFNRISKQDDNSLCYILSRWCFWQSVAANNLRARWSGVSNLLHCHKKNNTWPQETHGDLPTGHCGIQIGNGWMHCHTFSSKTNSGTKIIFFSCPVLLMCCEDKHPSTSVLFFLSFLWKSFLAKNRTKILWYCHFYYMKGGYYARLTFFSFTSSCNDIPSSKTYQECCFELFRHV